MSDAMDMATPVTRGELRAEIAQLEGKLETRFAQMATKVDLEIWGGALLERIKSVEQRFDRLEQRLSAELARHVNAICETLAA